MISLQRLTTLSFMFLLVQHSAVEATFSIAASDRATRQIGAAGASCVEGFSVYEPLYHGVPGHGILITQAAPPPSGSPVYDIGDALLLNGTDPAVIIKTITDPLVDNGTVSLMDYRNETDENTYNDYQLWQYGCVDLMGKAAGYEDPTLKEFYFDVGYVDESGGGEFMNYTQEHMTGTIGTFTYSAQGNIVVDTTVPALVDNFVQGNAFSVSDCDLADRLYRAISAPTLSMREAIKTNDTTLLN